MSTSLQLEPGPTFSQNGSGVRLSTSYGELNFNSEEYTYYQGLFQALDVRKQGVVRADSAPFVLLLLRLSLPWRSVEAALRLVSDCESPVDACALKMKAWLMLCKLLAHCIQSGREPKERFFRQLHTRPEESSNTNNNNNNHSNINNTNNNDKTKSAVYLDFKLGVLLPDIAAYKQFSVRVSDWKVYGDDFQTQHVKFRIASTVSLVNDTGVTIADIERNPVVERRYSEFEQFAQILQRNYRGLVCPPLPAKSFKYIPQQESVVQQRAIELQLFLDFLCSHPELRRCAELSIFLEAPSVGLKSLFDVHAHIHRGQLVFSDSAQRPRSGSGGQFDGVVKLLSDGAQAVSSGAQVVVGPSNKTMEYLSSLWGSVKKNVSLLTAPPPVHTIAQRDRQLMENTIQFFDVIHKTSQSLETVQSLSVQRSHDLHAAALAFQSLSELDSVPRFVQTLQCTSSRLGALSTAQQERLERNNVSIVIPAGFIGRFGERYKAATAQHSEALDALNDLHAREQQARRRVDTQLEQSSASTNGRQDELQKAQLALCEAETSCDAAKQEEEHILRNVRRESHRITAVTRHQLAAYLVRFAEDSRSAAEEARQHYEALFESLQALQAI